MYREKFEQTSTEHTEWKYSAVPEHLHSPYLGWYNTYSIIASEKRKNRWIPVGIVKDASPEKESAERMASLFTEFQLLPIHLKDAVEDMVGL